MISIGPQMSGGAFTMRNAMTGSNNIAQLMNLSLRITGAPQTNSLLHSGDIVFTTVAGAAPTSKIYNQYTSNNLSAMNNGQMSVQDAAGGAFSAIDGVFNAQQGINNNIALMNLCTTLNGVTNNSALFVRGSNACSYTSNVTNGGTMTIGGLMLL